MPHHAVECRAVRETPVTTAPINTLQMYTLIITCIVVRLVITHRRNQEKEQTTMSGPGRPGGGTDGRTHQSCPRTKSAQNMVPCAAQYTGHTAQLSMPAAAAPSAATTATSRATYHSDRQGLLRQQCSGTAARTSPMRNGGGFPASKPSTRLFMSSVALAAASST